MSKRDEKFTNKSIVELLRSIAATCLLKNENRFRIIAYEKAADAIEHMSRELHDIWQEGGIVKAHGIGPTISSHLEEYFSKGHAKHFDEVLKDIPPTVFILMRIPGIGPKKAFKLVKELELLNPATVVKDLNYACKQGRVAKLETFGEKSQQDILQSIALYEASKNKDQRMPMPYAMDLAQEVTDYLNQLDYIERIDTLGSLRRKVATIGDIDVAVSTNKENAEKVVQHFIKFRRAVSVDNVGPKKASIIVSPNIRIDLRVQESDTYGSMLQYFTGSKAHNVKLREYALRKGYSLSEWGIKETKTGKVHEFSTEEEFYKFIGLPYIQPEIREGTDEIQVALKNNLPELVEVKDIRGDFHIHSSYDIQTSHDLGADSYEDIVRKAQELQYEYVGFADHNPRTTNNSEADIVAIMKRRKEYIDQKVRTMGFPVFIGLEVDILPNGTLALPEKGFEYVDYLVVSIHSAFRQSLADSTSRVLKALSYPKVKIFGHPTGRLLGKRDGVDLDWPKIFGFVKKKDIALEVNSGPERLDLPDTLVRSAVNEGVKLVVDTDAHATEFMDGIFYGVSVARRGWATKHDIMNCKGLAELKKWLLS